MIEAIQEVACLWLEEELRPGESNFVTRRRAVANPGDGSDNHNVDHPAHTDRLRDNPFLPGTLVIVTLGNPREKFWGAILALRAEGLSLCGIELPSFEDLVSMVKEGEPFTPGVVFFPMHRIERMELDLPDGNIPSLAQRFTSSTGLDPVSALTRKLEAFGERK